MNDQDGFSLERHAYKHLICYVFIVECLFASISFVTDLQMYGRVIAHIMPTVFATRTYAQVHHYLDKQAKKSLGHSSVQANNLSVEQYMEHLILTLKLYWNRQVQILFH